MNDSMKDIRIVQNLPEEQWKDFVDRHPDGNIFHTPEMHEVFRRARDHKPELWAAVSGDHILALFQPVQVNVLPGLIRPLTTRSIAYGSVLYSQSQEGEDGLMSLLKAYRQAILGKALFIELRNLSDLSPIQQLLAKCHYSYVEYMNYLVDTSLPVDRVWGNISKSAQKNITKVLNKHQLDIVEVQDVSQIKQFYEVLKKTYTNAQIPLADYSLFEAAFQVLYPKGMVKFLLGRVEGQDIAASVILLYKDVVYGWYRGFDRAYASYLPNDLMVWDTLKWASEHHFRTFDFGGAGKPGEEYGPRQFKAKFGGKEVSYGRNIYTYSSNLLRMSKLGYKIFRYFLH